MVRVVRSTVIDAPIDAIWDLLRDFNSHDRWHPAIAESRIEGGRRADQVGCVRRFSLRTGGEIREQLLGLSDRDRRVVYCILDAPLPLIGYVAELQLRPVTDGDGTFWQWRSTFRTPPGREAELAALVGRDIYEAGFEAIRQRFDTSGGGGAGDAVSGPRERAEYPVRAPSQAPAVPARTRSATIAPRLGPIDGHAIVQERHGGPDVLVWRAVTVPPPGPGEVRIRQSHAGVNYIDVYTRTGYFDLLQPPGTIGMEGVGTVVDIGHGIDHVSPGDRVGYACAPVGAYAEVRTMPGGLLVRLPDDIDDVTAAATLLKGMSAAFLLHDVHVVGSGQTVLVHAAAGGVGTLLCQWASHLGATVIGTAGGPEKTARARANGCTHAIDYRSEDFVARTMDLTAGRGVDVAFDAVGRATFLKSIETLAPRGHLVSYGQASGDIGAVEIGGFASRSATVSRPNFGHYAGDAVSVHRLTERLFTALRRQILRPPSPRILPLRDAAEAHRLLEGRETTGAIVLRV